MKILLDPHDIVLIQNHIDENRVRYYLKERKNNHEFDFIKVEKYKTHFVCVEGNHRIITARILNEKVDAIVSRNYTTFRYFTILFLFLVFFVYCALNNLILLNIIVANLFLFSSIIVLKLDRNKTKRIKKAIELNK